MGSRGAPAQMAALGAGVCAGVPAPGVTHGGRSAHLDAESETMASYGTQRRRFGCSLVVTSPCAEQWQPQ